MSDKMKFAFNNLGPVARAEMELGDLTIISGRNNTGKTRIVYALYGFMKAFTGLVAARAESFCESHFQKVASLSTADIVARLRTERRVEWQVNEDLLLEEQGRLIQEVTQEFSDFGISQVFNTSQSEFENASLEAAFRRELPVGPLSLNIKKDLDLSIAYDRSTFSVRLSDTAPVGDDIVEPFLTKHSLERLCTFFLLQDPFERQYRPFILSSARHSIPLFLNELDYVRSQVMRAVQQQEDGQNGEPAQSSDPLKNLSRYALAIHDNIDFARSISGSAEKHDNMPQDILSGGIEEMMDGRFTSVNGTLRFTAGGNHSFDIPLHLASSSAWEMSGLYFLLGYFLKGVGLLIVDEPESHLDAENQVRLARLFARIVNSGTKVLITTHSDFILREVNNLIMLSSAHDEDGKEMEELGYEESDKLNLDQIRAYFAKNGGLEPCVMDAFGIEMPVIDETTEALNRTGSKLAAQIIRKSKMNSDAV
ncbi:MAG: AAA family ATPase [Caldilineaceae bacterium]|nr:AAA family ATPase [Caldilineaceae bacterium]MDE0339048.1 AAA family ATPase [Caldilineaceae bacterium]